MNLDSQGAAALVRGLLDSMPKPEEAPEVLVAPTFTLLASVAALLRNGPIRLSAQNLHWEEKGAFTGEVCANQVKDAGCTHVLIGHSERRQHFGETDSTVNKRLRAALKAGLVPVVCVGETLSEREAQKTFQVLKTQLSGALAGFSSSELSTLVVAYEPVWAIGTGRTATPQQAQEAHAFLRKTAQELQGADLAQGLRILYGGSVTAENVDTLMSEADVDGALVGGASLKAESFGRIIRFRVPASR
jgi:triosephosphate isomerase